MTIHNQIWLCSIVYSHVGMSSGLSYYLTAVVNLNNHGISFDALTRFKWMELLELLFDMEGGLFKITKEYGIPKWEKLGQANKKVYTFDKLEDIKPPSLLRWFKAFLNSD